MSPPLHRSGSVVGVVLVGGFVVVVVVWIQNSRLSNSIFLPYCWKVPPSWMYIEENFRENLP